MTSRIGIVRSRLITKKFVGVDATVPDEHALDLDDLISLSSRTSMTAFGPRPQRDTFRLSAAAAREVEPPHGTVLSTPLEVAAMQVSTHGFMPSRR